MVKGRKRRQRVLPEVVPREKLRLHWDLGTHPEMAQGLRACSSSSGRLTDRAPPGEGWPPASFCT